MEEGRGQRRRRRIRRPRTPGCCVNLTLALVQVFLDWARVTNHRLLYACIGFSISYTVLVYCIIDLTIIGALPAWSAMSTMTFIVGLWAVSPGQGLVDTRPKQRTRVVPTK